MPFNRPIPESKYGEPRRKSGGLDTLIQAEKLMQIAILLPSAAFLGWLVGSWLDTHLHQQWIAVVGIIFGGISGLVYVVRLVIAAGNAPAKKEISSSDSGRSDSTKDSNE